ncbi:MAG: hypothetical protein M1839_003696 [Geoglossum umbratile]|nr:MAG: hypothetical protein M1839_003696 [Geoglossum umbratile]
MLTGDCESVNGSGQRYRGSGILKCATVNRQGTSGGHSSGTADSGTGTSTGDGDDDGNDDDSSDEIEEDNEEESEAIAPSGELSSRKGKKCTTSIRNIVAKSVPAIVDTIGACRIHQTGLSGNGFGPHKPVVRGSVLQEDDGGDMKIDGLGTDYPRKKSVRRLSSNKGFLSYEDARVGKDLEENARTPNKNAEAIGSSDDESYKGVDLISDSEEDEPCVEESEARVIIDSEEETDCLSRTGLSINRSGTALSGRLSDWGDFDVEDGLLLDDVPLFNQQYTHVDHYLGHDVSVCNGAHNPANILDRPSSVRHVRFEDDSHTTDNTSSNTSDEDEDIFPDLFLEQDRIDPVFLRMIENDQDADDNFGFGGSEDGSYWDFRGSDDLDHGVDGGDNSSDTESSVGNSSGYESDEGETTDEDLPPPPTIRPTRSVLRRTSTSSLVGGGENTRTFFQRSLNQASRRVGPSMGSWIADPSKPVAFIDSTGKRMLVLPATQPATTHTNRFGPPGSSDSSIVGNSPRTAFSSFIDDSEAEGYSSQDFGAAIGFSGRNLMMGGLLNGAPGNEFILGAQVLGPQGAFYPFTSVDSRGMIEDYDDLEDEDLWSVSDFIDFGGGSSCSDNDDDQDTEVPVSPTTSVAANPASSLHDTPSAADNTTMGRDTAQTMINHFDKGVVGAFHRNQQRHRQFLTRPEPRAFSPSMSTVLRGIAIKGGRQAAANCPITPMRKRKAEHVFGASPSGSPLGGTSSKRRMLNAHKRSKSAF